MATLQRVIRAMEKIAPLHLAETAWDNVGVLVESPHPNPTGNRVFLTIDLSPRVLKEALSTPNVGVIVAYHPPLFRAIKKFTMADPMQRAALSCAAAGISIFSPHTALDSAVGGINDWIVDGLSRGPEDKITPVTAKVGATGEGPAGEGAGAGRIIYFSNPWRFEELVEKVKSHLGIKYVRVAVSDAAENSSDGAVLVKSVAVCAGSGASVLLGANADVYLTGELSHHEVLAANNSGSSVILCEHSNSERGYLSAVLAPKLRELFSEDGSSPLEVIVSSQDRDPLSVA
ncbi:GTP cyclohydrolase 1 type 2/Nif3 [Cladochytrium replicatum]|nr:GTP cyclohydrolase 1 type 2/Nif3 [Cladochytrium replicatum]